MDRGKNHLYCCVVYTARNLGLAARGRSSGLGCCARSRHQALQPVLRHLRCRRALLRTLSANGAQATTVAAAESARTQTGASSAEQMLRYNSFQFIYRQDIGRIVLIGQSPETGERVIQVPSEQVLRAYERTARVERQLARQQSDQSSSSAPSGEPAAVSAGAISTCAAARESACCCSRRRQPGKRCCKPFGLVRITRLAKSGPARAFFHARC